MPPAGLGFGRARRIRKRAEFLRIQESSARVSTRHLLILLAARLPPESEGAARLGVVASKKAGNAVVRARCKRLVREAFRRHPEIFPPRVDVVIVVRPGTHELSQAALDREIEDVRGLVHKRADAVLRAPPPAKAELPR